ncbi:hypothetical protein CDD82_4490 [Ophiocordyceps australis]|uniref:DNA2/NAM7 helicase-like C-terminal domain-containing protein n=1 Tax=Ophiocordyceps australis TaxID=1399860 RepID=A0A2C5Z2P9_9HYPO|nr:hypothetical protein CDD82_4490 [Ophiocordyceps australis]
MYQSIIASASPDIVIVEEAGEILESHVFAALSESVKHLILIGDHKQLRPKVNSYPLTVEYGEGYDLNMSLFERLIHQGHEYTTLQEQHRSHPDISYFTRQLAYPGLKDSPKVSKRPQVKGLQKRVIFVHHRHSESHMADVSDRHDLTINTSKENVFDADMVLKTVNYLAQQGYLTKDLVVLTPYLGQLSLLRHKLSKDHDPILNDFDNAKKAR